MTYIYPPTARTPEVSIWYNISVSNLVSLVHNLLYEAILSLHHNIKIIGQSTSPRPTPRYPEENLKSAEHSGDEFVASAYPVGPAGLLPLHFY